MHFMVQRYFVVFSAGHTGTAWLAKLLNSHFEVICFHELELMSYTRRWPPQVRAYFEFGPGERIRNLLYVFSPSHRYGDSYQVLGTTAWAGLEVRRAIEEVTAYFPDAAALARFFVLTRNPVSQIHSQMGGFTQMAECIATHQHMHAVHGRLSRQVLARMDPHRAHALQATMQHVNLDTKYFLHACLLYLRLVWATQDAAAMLPYRSVFRLEDLSQHPASLREAFQEITGLEYELAPAFTDKVNVKSGGMPPATLFQSWSPQQRRLFAQVFEPYEQALESLGYDLGELTAGPAASNEVPDYTGAS
jgi:hypothetical protein